MVTFTFSDSSILNLFVLFILYVKPIKLNLFFCMIFIFVRPIELTFCLTCLASYFEISVTLYTFDAY